MPIAAKVLALVAPLMLAAPAQVAAQGLTGERLYWSCGEGSSEADHALCLGFIRGIIDGARLQALRTAGNSIPEHLKTLMICDPTTAKADEAIGVVVHFIEARPVSRSLPAAVVVFQALGKAWPCQR